MESVHESTEQIAKRDLLDQEIESIRDSGMMDGGSLILNPAQERRSELQERRSKDDEETIANLKKQVQYYKDKVEQRLLKQSSEEGKDPKKKSKQAKPFTRKELLEELKKLADSEELDIVKRKLAEQTENARTAIQEKERFEKEYNQYRKDQLEILTEYQADQEIQKKVRQLQTLRQKYDALNNKLAKTEDQWKKRQYLIERDRCYYNETILPHYNAKISQVKDLDKELQQKRRDLNQLKQIKPLKADFSDPDSSSNRKTGTGKLPGWLKDLIGK